MKLVETLALSVLGIVLVIAVLQRANATTSILQGISGLTSDTVGALTGAPR
jgi:hypothetical protein